MRGTSAGKTTVLALTAFVGAGGCGGAWQRGRTVPALEAGFAAGARVKDDRAMPEVTAQVATCAGGTLWWHDGEGPARRYAGVGALASVTAIDLKDPEMGLDALFAPPRADRHAGFQFRLGPRIAGDLVRNSLAFAAEWAHWLVGAFFAEASYEFLSGDATFLVGARVNLLLPYTLVKVDARVIE